MGLEPIPDDDHRVGGWRRWRSWRKNATTTAGGGTCLCFNWLQLIRRIADPHDVGEVPKLTDTQEQRVSCGVHIYENGV
jgi:hypothetical protein